MNEGRTGQRRRAAAAAMILTLGMSLLAACTNDGREDAEHRVLRVGVIASGDADEAGQREAWTDAFELTHPDIEVKLVPAVDLDDLRSRELAGDRSRPNRFEALKRLLAGPDPVDAVVLDDATYYRPLTREGLLTPLDPMVQEDGFDLDDYVPSVVEALRDTDDRQLYALASSFNAGGLYVNKSLFAAAGVAPPTEASTWPDVMTLAKRIASGSGDGRIFGLSFDRWNADPFADARLYAMMLQLKLFDKQAWTMTVDTPQWNRVWTDVAGLYADRIVPSQEDLASVSNANADLFMSGRVAMAVGGYEYLSDLLAAKTYAKDSELRALDWEVVPLPAIPENPDIGGGLTLNGLMAIGAKARNPRHAWEFIRYNNSLEVSKLGARSTYRMPARKSLIKPRDGASYDPGVRTRTRTTATSAAVGAVEPPLPLTAMALHAEPVSTFG
ncbi:ABC transporter substrate-binding protein [Paenibacillus sp. GCM10023250]|uniref:ABC transporter substrate-binding protein n=1 Tax=Paenibacillus sp. GCM10023250 TaxID=3252648 RepID=UPI0036182E9F